ncbi:hypothetical protein GCM10007291_45140 [Gemmobacter nanjingensis]|uniref:Uncharacterized protein n=1 Tax=Gemmobacter nanjingensis TaxID=488454 RepID=A0ABQ3FSZ6_9RHOB|nr:hypothetical protein GCM10007291_45140 [Gemmobacter nanjingensis]
MKTPVSAMGLRRGNRKAGSRSASVCRPVPVAGLWLMGVVLLERVRGAAGGGRTTLTGAAGPYFPRRRFGHHMPAAFSASSRALA